MRGAFLFALLDQLFEFLPLLLHLHLHDAPNAAIRINALVTLNLLTHASFNVAPCGSQELIGALWHWLQSNVVVNGGPLLNVRST